jgi:hypothetical protein
MIQMASAEHSDAVDRHLKNWCETIAASQGQRANITIGLTSGSRTANDARVIFKIVKALQAAIAERRPKHSLLLCRLDVTSAPLELLSTAVDIDTEARLERSALGEWDHVEIDVCIGSYAPKSLLKIPRLLPKWKLRYDTIIVDLGAIHQVPSRTIGRLCDANFVIIGPNSSASAQWIKQYVDHHTACGSHIAGSIVAAAA